MKTLKDCVVLKLMTDVEHSTNVLFKVNIPVWVIFINIQMVISVHKHTAKKAHCLYYADSTEHML